MRRISVLAAAAMLLGPLPALPPAERAAGAPAVRGLPAPARGWPLAPERPKADPTADRNLRAPDPVTWPAGLAELETLGGTVSGRAPDRMPERVRIETLDRAASRRAGVDGPVLKVHRGSGPVAIGYAGFAHAYGGDWGARLRLVRLPECALSTPELAACRTAAEVPSVNDTGTRTVRATVAAGTVLALQAGSSSTQGSYATTKLSFAASWNVDLSTGAFSWSFPIRVPDVPGRLVPSVALGYSSQAMDGQTSVTNNQGSWVGEGFGYEPGFIQRRYKPCADDGHATSAEQCWAFHNGTMALAGHSGQLVKVDDNTWKLSHDDGSRIERFTGAANGDNDGEYWKLTTTDGTQMFFGLNRLPGWTSGNAETGSAWTHPVYGDDAGEPCHSGSGFASSACDQAWRWNLDHVIDPRGNVLSYYYAKEVNYYAEGGRTDVNGTPYVRGGYLTHIDYGQRKDQVYAGDAPARVMFTVAERCLPDATVDCDPEDLNASTARSWPDVPADLICAPNTRCGATQVTPTFFTRKRLTRIETRIRDGSGYAPVESWDLNHVFKANTDESRSLWLEKILHSGHWGGTTLSEPPVEFGGAAFANRIDRDGDLFGPLTRPRLTQITSSTGAQLHVVYAQPDCSANSLPAPGASTRRCYPVLWNPNGGDESGEVTDWFHKYVVDRVIQDDLVGGNKDMVWTAEFGGPAGWVKAKPDGITKDKYLSWTDWRGYGQVTVRRGDDQTMPERTDHAFLRGLGGTVADSTGEAHDDSDGLAGFELETTVYDGPSPVSKTINDPWRHVTHTQNESWGSVTSAFVRTGSTRAMTALAGGAWRENRRSTTYDPVWGRQVSTDERSGAGDRCTRTWYGDNPAKYFHSYVSRVQVVAVGCDATADLRTQLLVDSRTGYDLAGPGTPPNTGVPTRTETLRESNGTAISYQTEQESTGIDSYGRALAVLDSMGKRSTISYTDVNGLAMETKATNPLGHVTTTIQDRAYGLPVATIDANGRRTDREYDALGRPTAVWLPDRPKAAGKSPNVRYRYLNQPGQATVVTTETIDNKGGYRVAHEIFDGMLRSRQTQVPGDGGWLLTDTYYNNTGKVSRVDGVHRAAGTGGGAPILMDETDVEGQMLAAYDGAGRKVVETLAVAGTARWSEITSYGGDRVTVTPPAGGVTTTSVVDARGNTVELYKGGDLTRYAYWPGGQIKQVTDPLGNSWKYGYDQRGRTTLAEDPDAGDTTMTYDAAGRIASTLDSRGVKLSFTYDDLGRQTEVWQGERNTGVKLTSATYDTKLKGHVSFLTRHTPGGAYHISVEERDALYRSLRTRYWIPGAHVGSPSTFATYDYTAAYNPDGTIMSVGYPAAGDLAAEVVVTTYGDLARPTRLAGTTPYVTATSYDPLGVLILAELHTGGTGKKAWLEWAYEKGTGRLAQAKLSREGIPTPDRNAAYRYDEIGNVKSIVDTGAGQRDTQCFSHDNLRRMTEAWTTTSTAVDPCAGGPAQIGGPAPYWHTWLLDKTGNRTVETIHGLAGAPDTTRRYTYPAQGQGQNQPHTVRSVTTTGAPDQSYGYDPTGNTTSRPGQTLTWDAEGNLATSTPDGGQATSYVYDPAGERLVHKEPGSTTVYLPGMELRRTGGTLTATRYYAFAGQAVAVRRGGGKVDFLATDHHGTATHAVDATTGAVQSRNATPYGDLRGPAPSSWPDQREFLGASKDPTGLTHIGAREYDQALGRFISDDPVTVAREPQQLHGYSYGNANPVTMSDPSGACLPEYCGGPDERLPQEQEEEDESGDWVPPAEQKCLAHQRHSAWCQPDADENPFRIVVEVHYPRGSVLVVLADGTAILNGYILPKGVKDPYALAERVDSMLREDDFTAGPLNLLKATVAMTKAMCTKEICSWDAVKEAGDFDAYLTKHMLGTTGGICMGYSAHTSGFVPFGGSFKVCLVSARDGGTALYLHASETKGLQFPAAHGGGHWSIGIMESPAESIQGLRGQNWNVGGNAGLRGGAVYVNHSFKPGHKSYTNTIMFGPGHAGVGGHTGFGWSCVISLNGTAGPSGC